MKGHRLVKAPVYLPGTNKSTVSIEGASFQIGSAKRNLSACSIRCSTKDVGTDRSWQWTLQSNGLKEPANQN
ncbi:MAG: hypothetical protein ACYS80_27065 [Planctomycetota bacterium]